MSTTCYYRMTSIQGEQRNGLTLLSTLFKLESINLILLTLQSHILCSKGEWWFLSFLFNQTKLITQVGWKDVKISPIKRMKLPEKGAHKTTTLS
jgi:hypothetical protein